MSIKVILDACFIKNQISKKKLRFLHRCTMGIGHCSVWYIIIIIIMNIEVWTTAFWQFYGDVKQNTVVYTRDLVWGKK